MTPREQAAFDKLLAAAKFGLRLALIDLEEAIATKKAGMTLAAERERVQIFLDAVQAGELR